MKNKARKGEDEIEDRTLKQDHPPPPSDFSGSFFTLKLGKN